MPKVQTLVEIDKPIYPIWQGLYKSLYSKLYYEDVILRWKGPGYLYLGMLVLILSIAILFPLKEQLFGHVLSKFVQPLKHMPVLHLINGQLVVFEKQPYLWRNNQEVELYINTTEQLNARIFKNYPHLLLYISKHDVAIAKPKILSDGNPKYLSPSDFVNSHSSGLSPLLIRSPMSLSNQNNFTNTSTLRDDYYIFNFSGLVFDQFDGNKFIDFLHKWHIGAVLLVVIAIMLWFFLWSSLFVIFLTTAALGKFYAKFILRVDLTFVQSCRSMIVCFTPVIYLCAASLILNIELYHGIGLYVVIAYFSLMVFLYGQAHRQLVRQ